MLAAQNRKIKQTVNQIQHTLLSEMGSLKKS
jgi:hypothetical protein